MRKASRRAAEFPVATIAPYGPDNACATKLVVSIVQRRESGEPHATRPWTTETEDVRSNPSVTVEVAAFISEYRVKRTVAADRIIGCPHEEGVDYPMGRTCPQCPFWADIDRFTHEPVRAPMPSMPAEDVLRALAEDELDGYTEALASADAHKEALVGPLLDALERGIVDPIGASKEEASTFSYALYPLAKWREPRAYPYAIRWLNLPEEQPFDIAGDIVTQDGARILAAVCDGNLEPIKALILNRQADQYGRSAVWDSLAADSADIEALELFPELRRAYDAGLIDPQSVGRSELDAVEAMTRGEMVRKTRERHPPIDNVAAAIAWWDRRVRDTDAADDLLLDGDDDQDGPSGGYAEISEPYRAPLKVGRNEPCSCGSGKKYKKCCGR